jgi:hypothetical protein
MHTVKMLIVGAFVALWFAAVACLAAVEFLFRGKEILTDLDE